MAPHLHLLSAHVGDAIAPEHRLQIEAVAAYLVKSPLSLKKLVYLDGRQAVLYRSKMNPFRGGNFEALDPLEWMARLADHIPDPRQHRTLFYGHYANRSRGARRLRDTQDIEEAGEPRRRCSPTWARLIARVYEVDPLTCTRGGGKIAIVGFVTDQLAIRRILDHLGLSSPVQEPPLREMTVVTVDDEGRELVTP